MESILFLGFVVVIIAIVVAIKSKVFRESVVLAPHSPYKYIRKPYIMTASEVVFYKRLQGITQGRYIVFPQIHLSSLATNMTSGNYRKAGFQRINRRSVDYILADPETLQAVYAVELDDRTHDTEKGRAVDALKTEILQQIGLPLVRFRDVQAMNDQDIIHVFETAHKQGVE